MKGFGIYVKNDLLEPKHVKQMKESVWLYMWFLDKMTSVNENGEGKILGGKPITYEDVDPDLGIHRNTFTKYLSRLREYGYIKTLRTPRGHVVVVNKAAKAFKGSTRSSDSQTRVIHTKQVSDSHDQGHDSHEPVNAIKTIQGLNKDKTITPSARNDVQEVFNFYVQEFGVNPNMVKLSDARKRKLQLRIKDAGVEMLKLAITNTARSPHHRGENDRGWKADLDWIIITYEKLERLANMNTKEETKKRDIKEILKDVEY